MLEGKAIGIIGLVAFTEEQRDKIVQKHKTLSIFMSRMADLIASKYSEAEKRNQLNAILESMHEGLIALNKNGFIVSCNSKAEKLLHLSKEYMEGRLLSDVWNVPELKKSWKAVLPSKIKKSYIKKKGKNQKISLQ